MSNLVQLQGHLDLGTKFSYNKSMYNYSIAIAYIYSTYAALS